MPSPARSGRGQSNLLSERALEQSPIVANCRMNRERVCLGGNSYAKELRFNSLDFLKARLQTQPHAAWLDLCCGRGRALIEAAQELTAEGLNDRVTLLGIDLIEMFDEPPTGLNCLHLQAASLVAWEPRHDFDLITCVHGLHYIGDKLRLIQRACRWLTPDGIFITHLDLKNLKLTTGKSSSTQRDFLHGFRRAGLTYNSRSHLLQCRGRKPVTFRYDFEGADDAAGPNFTGQPAVDSHYRRRENGG